VNRSSTITVTNSNGFNLIPKPKQQLNQSIPDAVIHINNLFSKLISTEVSIQHLRRKLEVVVLNDSAVGSGQPTERKTKNLGNIGLDIKTDLRVIEKENPSRRISEGLEATRSEQQHGTSARNNESKKTRIPISIYMKAEEKISITKPKKINPQTEKSFTKRKNAVSQIKEDVCLIKIEEQSRMIAQLKRDAELCELKSYKKFQNFLTPTFYMKIIVNYRNSQKSKKEILSSDITRNYLAVGRLTGSTY
jgi:hypothetical protein